MKNRFSPGDIVRHFKRELLSEEEKASNKYMYEIIGAAIHSETREPMMVYRPLYDDGGMYVRPLEMFLSEVDHEKYPEVKQKYRFEKIMTVPLSLIQDAVDMASSEWTQYLDIEKMEIISIPEDRSIYDEEELEELEEIIEEGFGTRFYRLPDQFDVHDHSIMERFVWSLPMGEMQEHLDNAIHRSGAFRRFREEIRRYGIEQEWYDFKEEAYKQIAKDWCEVRGIRYTE